MTRQRRIKGRLPKYCVEDVDRHGKIRIYLRVRGHPKVSLPGMPWSSEFMAAYGAGLGGPQHVPTARVGTHTWAWLCQKYFASAELRILAPRTQLIRRRILE